ncbi:MAG: recombinase family protein [Planctomycetia bacterium]|nr:recombinase family protein [Planctomycetia bacterium]
MKSLIAYYRVSTKQQGDSGLGLEAQAASVRSYASQSSLPIAGVYVEVESGKLADRPQLSRALAHAKRAKAVLVVAKLDRLARNVEFTAALLNSGVEFVACDNPTANRLTIHILAAVAEDEARRISERTKAALAAAKARGTLLGSARVGHWTGRESLRLAALERARTKAITTRQKKAHDAYVDLIPLIESLRNEGKSLQAIATHLTKEGHETRRGCEWSPMQVSRLLKARPLVAEVDSARKQKRSVPV